MPNKLILIIGPSGVGKTTICNTLLERGKLQRAITATTRPPRKSEQHGRDYYFLTPEEFQKRLSHNEFLEYAQVHSFWYGTPKRETLDLLEKSSVLLIVDVAGALSLMSQNIPQLLTIFLLPPDEKELENRLRQRGDTSDIENRLEAAKKEMLQANKFHVQLVNLQLEETLQKIEALTE